MQRSLNLLDKVIRNVDRLDRLIIKPTKKTTGPSDAYLAFQRKYYMRPDLFVKDCFVWGQNEGPAEHQIDALKRLITYNRLAMRGPHGMGKTAFASWCIWWFSLTRDGEDWKMPTTASVHLQVKEYLWPEVHKWASRLRWDIIGRPPVREKIELMDLSIRLRTGSAFAAVTGKASSIEGAHAEHVFVVFDEAKAISDPVFNAIEGAFSVGKEHLALAISTPGDATGRFHDIQMQKPGYEDWNVRHVTRDECIKAGRMRLDWAEARLRQWGADNAVYINRVLGDFADQKTQNGLIPRAWVQLARARWRVADEMRHQWRRMKGFGIDVAESPDSTVFAPKYDWNGAPLIDTLEVLQPTIDQMLIASAVEARTRQWNRWARIDVIGMGAGVFDRARQLGVRVEGFDARGTAEGKLDVTGELTFANMRAWAYWRLRDMLNPANGISVALPDDQMLEDELCAHTYRQRDSGLYEIRSKDHVKKAIGRSPDRADAVVIALLPDPVAPKPQPGRAPSRQIG